MSCLEAGSLESEERLQGQYGNTGADPMKRRPLPDPERSKGKLQ